MKQSCDPKSQFWYKTKPAKTLLARLTVKSNYCPGLGAPEMQRQYILSATRTPPAASIIKMRQPALGSAGHAQPTAHRTRGRKSITFPLPGLAYPELMWSSWRTSVQSQSAAKAYEQRHSQRRFDVHGAPRLCIPPMHPRGAG